MTAETERPLSCLGHEGEFDGMRRVCVFALVALFSAACYSQHAEQDWLIVPGKRVGPITLETSDASLEALFGTDNVQRGDVDLGEAFTAPGTVLYPNDATRMLEVVWSDNARTTPKEVRLSGDRRCGGPLKVSRSAHAP